MVCDECGNYSICKDNNYICPAKAKLHEIYKQTRTTDRHQLVKKLQKQLNIRDAEPNKDMQKLAERIIARFPELSIIPEYGIRIGYVLSQEQPPGTKIKYADCCKVKLTYQAWLPYDFIITFYEPNTELLSENQKKILMLHELKHIGIGEKGLKLEEHDREDFADILKRYGIDWNCYDEEVPDILGEDPERIDEDVL
ncbi:MAG: putative metallopeptidase [Clostridiaceae bacterium]